MINMKKLGLTKVLFINKYMASWVIVLMFAFKKKSYLLSPLLNVDYQLSLLLCGSIINYQYEEIRNDRSSFLILKIWPAG